MKSLSQELKMLANGWLTECDPDVIIEHVMGYKTQIMLKMPTLARNVTCPTCKGSKGFFIPHLKTWSCLKNDCIEYHAGFDMHLNEQKGTVKPVISLRQLGIDLEYDNANLGDCTQSVENIKILKKFADEPKGFIGLVGKVGTGKTYAAIACLAKYLQNGGDSARFVKASNLYYEWLQIKLDGKGDLGFIEKYTEPQFLIVDDILPIAPTDAYSQVFYMIMDKRRTAKKGTIVATNLNSKKFIESYGDAVYSRIFNDLIITCVGDDRRKTARF